MKNNVVAWGILLVAILGVASCKQNEKTCKLGKYYISDASSTPAPNTFFYYEDGSLQKIEYSNGSTDTLFYTADTLHLLTYDERDSLTSVFTGVLNANGDVVSGFKTVYDFMGNVLTTDNYSLQYNGNGNLEQLSVSNSSGLTTTTYEYAAGNRSIGKLFSGATLQKKVIYFHNQVINKTDIDDDLEVFNPYFGKPSQNLLDSMWVITGSDTSSVIFSYQLDNNGYVTSSVRAQRHPTVDTRYYTYAYFDCRE